MLILPQPTKDIFHVDNGIVYELAYSYGETSERHRVDREMEHLEDDRRRYKGERNGSEGDRGCPEVQQEEEQNDNDQDGAVAQRLLHVADGGLDEVRLLE